MSALDRMVDNAERRRIRRDLDATLFVEAAAGTGKTTELIERIVAVLRSSDRYSLERIVAVTFTEKAAGEMKLRLRAEIERARGGDGGEVRARLERALGQLELARIGTIHSFCADLLRERPIEAHIDPLFQVAAEEEAQGLLDQAFESWFQSILDDPPEGVRRILRRRPRGWDGSGSRDMLRSAAGNLVEHRDFPERWRRDPFDRRAAIDRLMQRLAEVGGLAARAERSDDYLAQSIATIQRFVQETALREGVRGRDYDGLEAELRELLRPYHRHWRWRGSRFRPYGPDLPRDEVIARRDALREELEKFREQADADLAPLLQQELQPAVEGYERLKRQAGRLDFLDLLVVTRDLLRDDPEVRRDFQERFTHYFVDEFQDTDPLQAEILLLLAADDPAVTDWREASPVPGKLFVVGDPKQSIYRFRRADVAIYENVKRQVCACGGEVIHLRTSFRAVPSIQTAVNAAFSACMQVNEHGSQAAYVALERFREATGEQPAVVALPVPRPYQDYGNRAFITQRQIEESLPDAVGAYVDWLVNHSGWTVMDREQGEEPVPIQPRHVCLLFRRLKRFRDDVTRPYVRALEARHIPHVLVGGRSFHDREEVLAVRNALCAIEWPDDELRVFATLRGPFFALGDDRLLAYRHRYRRLHPLRRHEEGALAPGDTEVTEALAVLARLHGGRNRRPIAETISRFLAAVRAHAGIAIWPTGEQALANCLRMIDLARRFERAGAPSFRAFVERMEDEAERGAAEEAPAVEEGTEGVRIMTVHKAKGLEFPVVILADPTCKAIRDTPTRHIDPDRRLWFESLCGSVPVELQEAKDEELRRDREEAVRLAYVAATRARDLLVVPVVGDRDGADDGGWIDALGPAVFPADETRRAAQRTEDSRDFGSDSVLDRPSSADGHPGGPVAPGMHRPRAGEHPVLWWDPAQLDLDREQSVGLRQQRILEADEGNVAAEAGARAHERWQEQRRHRLEQGIRESLRPRPATQLALEGAAPSAPQKAAAPPAPPVNLIELPVNRRHRPHGTRFGTLVHATLATVPLDADDERVRAVATLQGRMVGAHREEVDAATEVVRAALASELLQRARTAEVRRECPLMHHLDDGTLVEGIVDLAFRENGEWTVVDFKTDVEIHGRRPEYEEQVRIYARAITAATGQPAHPVLLVV